MHTEGKMLGLFSFPLATCVLNSCPAWSYPSAHFVLLEEHPWYSSCKTYSFLSRVYTLWCMCMSRDNFPPLEQCLSSACDECWSLTQKGPLLTQALASLWWKQQQKPCSAVMSCLCKILDSHGSSVCCWLAGDRSLTPSGWRPVKDSLLSCWVWRKGWGELQERKPGYF